MDSKHRDILRRNRMELLRNIEPNQELLSFLQAKKTLNEDMVEEIEHKVTKKNKVGALLDILPRRGPHAFRAFVEALVEAGQGFIANSLDQQIANRYREETGRDLDDTYPEGTPIGSVPRQQQKNTKVDDSAPFIMFDIKSVSPKEGYAKNTDDANYPMKSNPRGRVVILNIEKFSSDTKFKNRYGSGFDAINLMELFKKLHFDVILLENLKAVEIKNEIKKEQKAEHHKKYDAFFMIILSHGEKGKIISEDGIQIDIIEEIVNQFNGINCINLINKPKMFFIQACQGAQETPGVLSSDGADINNIDDIDKLVAEHCDAASGDATSESAMDTSDAVRMPLKPMTHEQADLYVAYATVPGYKAWRHNQMGSWFMRDLVTVFAEYSHMEHVADMIVRVNHLVDKRTVEKSQSRQICRVESQLRRKVYLLPGYFE